MPAGLQKHKRLYNRQHSARPDAVESILSTNYMVKTFKIGLPLLVLYRCLNKQ